MSNIYDILIPILNLLSWPMIFFSEHTCKIKLKLSLLVCLLTKSYSLKFLTFVPSPPPPPKKNWGGGDLGQGLGLTFWTEI